MCAHVVHRLVCIVLHCDCIAYIYPPLTNHTQINRDEQNKYELHIVSWIILIHSPSSSTYNQGQIALTSYQWSVRVQTAMEEWIDIGWIILPVLQMMCFSYHVSPMPVVYILWREWGILVEQMRWLIFPTYAWPVYCSLLLKEQYVCVTGLVHLFGVF